MSAISGMMWELARHHNAPTDERETFGEHWVPCHGCEALAEIHWQVQQLEAMLRDRENTLAQIATTPKLADIYRRAREA